jgi:hypothetical protein
MTFDHVSAGLSQMLSNGTSCLFKEVASGLNRLQNTIVIIFRFYFGSAQSRKIENKVHLLKNV